MYLKLGVLVCQMKILKRVLARTTEIMNRITNMIGTVSKSLREYTAFTILQLNRMTWHQDRVKLN